LIDWLDRSDKECKRPWLRSGDARVGGEFFFSMYYDYIKERSWWLWYVSSAWYIGFLGPSSRSP
jgi:hypothetical protein